MITHATSVRHGLGGWPLLPERGTVSLFEVALLAACIMLVA